MAQFFKWWLSCRYSGLQSISLNFNLIVCEDFVYIFSHKCQLYRISAKIPAKLKLWLLCNPGLALISFWTTSSCIHRTVFVTYCSPAVLILCTCTVATVSLTHFLCILGLPFLTFGSSFWYSFSSGDKCCVEAYWKGTEWWNHQYKTCQWSDPVLWYDVYIIHQATLWNLRSFFFFCWI